jgi:hypothetical protein
LLFFLVTVPTFLTHNKLFRIHKTVEKKVFFIFLLVDRRIRTNNYGGSGWPKTLRIRNIGITKAHCAGCKNKTFKILMGAGKLVFGWMKKQMARMSTLSKLGNLIGLVCCVRS